MNSTPTKPDIPKTAGPAGLHRRAFAFYQQQDAAYQCPSSRDGTSPLARQAG